MATIAPRGVVPIPSDVDLHLETFPIQHSEHDETEKTKDLLSLSNTDTTDYNHEAAVTAVDSSTKLSSIPGMYLVFQSTL